MVGKGKGRNSSSKVRARRPFAAEEEWIRDFVGFYTTDNVIGCSPADFNGVSLTRAFEAVAGGVVLSTNKSDGPGTECLMQHHSDDGTVELLVHFEANQMRLEIQEARYIEENESDPDAA